MNSLRGRMIVPPYARISPSRIYRPTVKVVGNHPPLQFQAEKPCPTSRIHFLKATTFTDLRGGRDKFAIARTLYPGVVQGIQSARDVVKRAYRRCLFAVIAPLDLTNTNFRNVPTTQRML